VQSFVALAALIDVLVAAGTSDFTGMFSSFRISERIGNFVSPELAQQMAWKQRIGGDGTASDGKKLPNGRILPKIKAISPRRIDQISCRPKTSGSLTP